MGPTLDFLTLLPYVSELLKGLTTTVVLTVVTTLTGLALAVACLLYTSPSPRDKQKSRMPSSA